MALRVQVLRGYRGLLRAARLAFQSDNRTLVAFQQELRQRFEADRSIGQAEVKQRLHEMKDVEEFMRNNLVQGRLNQRGNFEVKLEDRHKEKMEQDEHLTPVDTSVIGQQVTIEHSCGKKDMKHNPDETIVV